MNHAKKVQAVDGLEPGEQVLSALFVRPSGGTAQVVGGAAGGLVGAGIAGLMGRRKRQAAGDENAAATVEGNATKLRVTAPGYVALTDRRWLVLNQAPMSGKPKEIVATLAHQDVSAIAFEKGALVGSASVRCADGSVEPLELPRGNPVEEFASAANSVGCTATVA